MPMGLLDGVILSIQICSIGQWVKIMVMVMGFVGTFEQGMFYICKRQLFAISTLARIGKISQAQEALHSDR